VIVVDVNVIVYLLTETPQRELARQVHERDGDWLVPPLWRHEMLNVLATLTRQDVLNTSSALTVWRNALTLLGSREQRPDMEYALSLAIEHGISAYDAQYVALAASLGIQLVSEDKKLQRVLPDRAVSMTDVTASVPEEDGDE
jgi:predicted nucleic acid-binding protein